MQKNPLPALRATFPLRRHCVAFGVQGKVGTRDFLAPGTGERDTKDRGRVSDGGHSVAAKGGYVEDGGEVTKSGEGRIYRYIPASSAMSAVRTVKGTWKT